MLGRLLGRLYQRGMATLLGIEGWAAERLPALVRNESHAAVSDAVNNLLGGATGRPDLERLTHWLASVDSARYITAHMGFAANLVERDALIRHALAACRVDGLVLEFGVYRGETLRIIAQNFDGPVYGFDSFEGLPEDWTHFQRKGRFSLDGGLPVFEEPNVTLVRGWFDETLSSFASQHPGPVRFLHVDSDLYSSARTVLTGLADRLVSGSVILFDEYFNYPGWQEHEFRAFKEFIATTGHRYTYLGYASRHQAVAVQLV